MAKEKLLNMIMLHIEVILKMAKTMVMEKYQNILMEHYNGYNGVSGKMINSTALELCIIYNK